ncbi:helix-turn-helix transcriptional regulator [Actinoplanes sp. NPDC026619]|uniref:helix-turn-helix domain-containing protein n=1 Tax=Actinoplanes sp. NPDC026619 TaxID=3155798 RepID=UPI0033FF7D87
MTEHTRPHLTQRESAVLGLLAGGLTAAAIARRLGISERTVHRHQNHLYRKLGVSDRLVAVLRAYALGLLELTPPTGLPPRADDQDAAMSTNGAQ